VGRLPREENALSQLSQQHTSAVQSSLTGVQNGEVLIEELIHQIRAGHPSAACQLREFLARGVRWYLNRKALDTSIEAGTRGVLDAVISAIEDGRVADLADLTSLTRILAQECAGKVASPQRRERPVERRNVETMKQALAELSWWEKDALLRYFEGQQPERICADLHISSTSLKHLRLRLQTRCGELAACH
jgi:hypothetical protein